MMWKIVAVLAIVATCGAQRLVDEDILVGGGGGAYCPQANNVMKEYSQRIEYLEVKVRYIKQTCTRRHKVVTKALDYAEIAKIGLDEIKSILRDGQYTASSSDWQFKIQKWLKAIETISRHIDGYSVPPGFQYGQWQTCVTEITEVTKRITRIKTHLRELQVSQSCDHLTVKLRELDNEYQRIDTIVKKYIDITQKKDDDTIFNPLRGRILNLNSGGAPINLGNKVDFWNVLSSLSGSQLEFFGSNSMDLGGGSDKPQQQQHH